MIQISVNDQDKFIQKYPSLNVLIKNNNYNRN